MIVFQVSGSQETFHQIFKRVQKVAEGVLVHPLQQGQQDPGIEVGEKRKLDKIPDKKNKIPEKKNLAVGLNMCSLVRRSSAKSRYVPIKNANYKDPAKSPNKRISSFL